MVFFKAWDNSQAFKANLALVSCLLIFFPLWSRFNVHMTHHRVGAHFFSVGVVQQENALLSIAQDDETKMAFQVFQLGTLVFIFLLIGELLVF